MRRPPEVHYAKNEGTSIAYQVIGEGPPDLVYVPGLISHLEHQWEIPQYRAAIRRLAAFTRVIAIDRRGTGLSDRLSLDAIPPLEVLMEDVRSVVDEVGTREASLFGTVQGGHLVTLFASRYPDRTRALVLWATVPAGLRDQDLPWMWGPKEWEDYFAGVAAGWGTQRYFEDVASQYFPDDHPEDPDVIRSLSWMRTSASPGAAAALARVYMETDIREVLPSVRARTLVLHREDDKIESIEGSRYTASKIPGATFVALPGGNHFWYSGYVDPVLSEIQGFLTGTHPMLPVPDRQLLTILFTDIVESTEHAARLGDRRWKELLAEHDARARDEIDRFRGRFVDSTGDGLLATFDSPARAVRCAEAIDVAVADLGITIRAGAHTGEVELDGDAIRGLTVHAGARVASLAGPSEVLVTQTVKDLVSGSGLRFESRGVHTLKGVPGRWHLFLAIGS